MVIAGGGGRKGQVFLFLDIFTKGFGYYFSRDFWFIGWGIHVVSMHCIRGVPVRTGVSMCRGGGATHGVDSSVVCVWGEWLRLSMSWKVVGPCVMLWCCGVSSGVSSLLTRERPAVLGGSGGAGSWQRGGLGVAGSVAMPCIVMHVVGILWVVCRVVCLGCML